MAQIGSLSVKLGLVTVEWDQATAKVKQQAKDLQKSFDDLSGNIKTLYGHWKTLGGSLSVSALGLGELISQTLEFSNAVKDLSQSFDISVAKTLQFREAIKTSGGNAEQAGKMLSTLFGKIDDALKGNEATISQFERMGISFKELNQLSPEQSLNRVFDALSKIGNTYERVKLVKEMLGKQGVGIAVDEAAQKLNMSTAAFKQHEANIKKLGDVSDNLEQSMDNLKIAFADMIGPLARDGVVTVEKFKAAMVGMFTAAVVGGAIELGVAITKIVAAIREGAKIQAAMTAMSGGKGVATLAAGALAYIIAKREFDLDVENAVAAESSGDSEKQDELKKEASRRELTAGQAKIDLLRKQIEFAKQEGQMKIDALSMDKYSVQLREIALTQEREIAAATSERAQALNKENLSAGQRGQIGIEFQKKQDLAWEKGNQATALVIKQREKEIALMGIQTQYARQIEDFDVKRLDLEMERAYMTDFEYKKQTEILQSQRKIAELNQQIIDARNRLGEGKTYEAEKQRIEDLIRGEEHLSSVRMQSLQLAEKQRTSFSEGWNEAFLKFQQDATNYGKMGFDAFNSFTNNISSAIDNFVKTGKMSFKDLARSIIQDLIAIQMKAASMRFLNGMFSMFSGFAGGANMQIATGTIGDYNSLGDITRHASGGVASGNTPTLVGENGPELFIPGKSGTVIPNNQLSGMMGQSTNVTNNYINAIDTKSFEDRLLGSPNAIWAANQYANKSLAVNRGRA